MTRAEDMLALGDGRRTVEACDLALRDDFINSVLSIKSRVLILKAWGLLMTREFPEAKKVCESVLNSELCKHTPPQLVHEIEALLEIAKSPPELVTTPLGFTGMTVTGESAMLEEMNNMATRLNSVGRYSEALEIAKRCQAAFGPWDITLVNLANAFAGLRQWEAAKEHFQYTIEMNPHNQLAYYNYALFLFNRGEVESALSNLDFALEVDPELSFAWSAKARLLARSFSRYEEALDCFDHAIKLDPYNAALRGERAELAEEVSASAGD
jgi:tetratricopeptide (TPR) repeat protein